MWKRIKTLVIKEFLAALRDPKARMLLIFPPVLQTFVFSFAFTQEARNIDLGILNQDGGQPSVELIQRFRDAETFRRIVPVGSRAGIDPLLDEQKVLAVLVVPPDFSSSVSAGRPAPVQLLLDGRRTNAAQIVQGYAHRIAADYARTVRLGTASPGVSLYTRRWFNPNLDYIWYTVPSLACVLTTVVGLLLTALSVAREREMGTFEQLLVSPLRPHEIILGKAAAALALSLASGALIVLVGVVIFRIPFQGAPLLLFGAMALFLLSIVGVGLFISSLSMTQQQAILGSFVFVVPAVLLSGFATPIENMPEWLQPVTVLIPLRWFFVIARGVFLKGMGVGDVLSNAWPLALIAMATLSAAGWLFRKRME